MPVESVIANTGIQLASALCELGSSDACKNGEDVYYPGSTFFIDPESMTYLQLIFVFLIYGYVLFISADMIGDGAELLLLVPAYADMVGSIVLPILGAIPDGMMVLFSGVGPIAVAQENVAVGIGALAGSTIMLLTLPWILAVYAGQVDMDDNGVCVGYKQPAGKRQKTKKTACQFQDGVSKNAILMFLTSLSYFVIQIPALMVDDQKTKDQYPSEQAYVDEVGKESQSENSYALYGIIVTAFFFSFYLYLQFLAATNRAPPISVLKYLLPPTRAAVDLTLVKQHGLLATIDHYRENYKSTGKMRGADPNVTIAYDDALLGTSQVKLPKDISDNLKLLFKEYAAKTPEKGGLHGEDMRQVLSVIGLHYTPADFGKMFAAADKDGSKFLDLNEFLDFFASMITGDKPLPYQSTDIEKGNEDEGEAKTGDDEDDEDDEMPDEFKSLSVEEQQKQIKITSVKKMLMGTVLVLLFSDPMVDVLSQIGKVTGVPAFYVSFVLAPLASNASELVSSMKLAARKTQTSITQSLQTLEGAACMNNTFCLGIFYILIYVQGLAWKFTAETISIFLVQVLVFILVISSNKQTMVQGAVIFSCYPVSLVVVAVLEAMGLD